MNNMQFEKVQVIKWIRGLSIDEWFKFSTVLEREEEVRDKIFNCTRCREEYGECGEHEGQVCEERFREHSLRGLQR
jgi:hypothetical protein